MLQQMLLQNVKFQELPASQREIFLALASVFEDNDLAIWLGPDELEAKMGRGNKRQWSEFLQLDTVNAYINAQTQQYTQVANRKAIQALSKTAAGGDVQAAKRINELSGIMNKDNNKIVVLHRVDRPREKDMSKEVPTDGEESV